MRISDWSSDVCSSDLSLSSISLATVTPSLVMRGAPKLLSITTLRPLGPSVTFTALARISTPRRMPSRASRPNLTSLAAMCFLLQLVCLLECVRIRRSADDPHYVAFLHDQQVFAVELDFVAGPLAEQQIDNAS